MYQVSISGDGTIGNH